MESIVKRLVNLGYDQDLADSMAKFYERRGDIEGLADYINAKEKLIQENGEECTSLGYLSY